MTLRKMLAVLRGACLLVFPAALCWVTLYCRIPSPGNSLFNDPDWYYLGNGALVASGERVFLVEHPGIPVSLLVGLLIRLRMIFAPMQPGADLVAELWAHSTRYHEYVGNVVLALNVLSLLLLGLWLWRRGFSVFAAAATQGLLLLSPLVPWFSARPLPEGLSVFGGVLLCVAVLPFSAGEPVSRARAFVSGVALGLVNSIKLTFAPALLFLLAAGRTGILFAGAGCFLTFSAFTLAAQPRRALHLWKYFFALATHQGLYSTGDLGFPGPKQILENLHALRQESAFGFFQLAAFVLFSLVVGAASRRWTDARARRMAVACLLALLVGVLVQAKHPGWRYAMPTMMLAPVLFALFWGQEKERRWKAGVAGLMLVLVAFGAPGYWTFLCNTQVTKRDLVLQETEAEAFLTTHEHCLQVFQESISSYRWSNFSADAYSGARFGPRLDELYPHTWIYAQGRKAFYNYRRIIVPSLTFGEILKESRCATFLVRPDLPDPFTDPSLRMRRWKKVIDREGLHLYYSDAAEG